MIIFYLLIFSILILITVLYYYKNSFTLYPLKKKNLIIGSYHKTGSKLFRHIWRNYNYQSLFFTKFNFIHSNNFYQISDNQIKNSKCIVLIRNPYEIIMSGVRYHQITKEIKFKKKEKKYNNLSYQNYLRSLTEDDKILFEMNNKSFETIINIYNDIKYRNFNKNILFIKLEDLYDLSNIKNVVIKINNHLDNDINIDKLIDSFLKKLKIDFHRTNYKNEYTYNKHFNKIHYDNFNKIFPEDILKVIPYN